MDDSVLLIIPVALDADVSLHVLVSKGTLHRPALTRDLCIVLLKLYLQREMRVRFWKKVLVNIRRTTSVTRILRLDKVQYCTVHTCSRKSVYGGFKSSSVQYGLR
jgi:hypothetical protein